MNSQVGSEYILEGRLEQALSYYLNKEEKHYKELANIALIYQLRGNLEKAEDYYIEAINRCMIYENQKLIYINLAVLYQQKGDYKKSMEIYDLLSKLQRLDACAAINRGTMFHSYRQYGSGLEYYKELISKGEEQSLKAVLYNNYGNLLCTCGKKEEAEKILKKAIAENPVLIEAKQNLLTNMLYSKEEETHINCLLKDIVQFYKTQFKHPKTNRKSREMTHHKLRIGYLSTEIKRNKKGGMITEIIKRHNKSQFDLYIYSDNLTDDKIAFRLKSYVNWRATFGLSEQHIYEMVKTDEIDILIDLNGFGTRNKHGIFCMKPAPISLLWNPYKQPITTDYYDGYITKEPIVVMDEAFIECEEIERERRGGRLLIGYIGDFKRLSMEELYTFKMILDCMPNAKIVIQSLMLDDIVLKTTFKVQLEKSGIPLKRVILYGRLKPYSKYIGLIKGLDCIIGGKYTSTALFCEALKCNTPIILDTRYGINKSVEMAYALNLEPLIYSGEETYLDKLDTLFKIGQERLYEDIEREIANYNEKFMKEYEGILSRYTEEIQENTLIEELQEKEYRNYNLFKLKVNNNQYIGISTCYGDVVILNVFS